MEIKGSVDLLTAMKLSGSSHKVLSGEFRIPVKHTSTSPTVVQRILYTSKSISGIPHQNKGIKKKF